MVEFLLGYAYEPEYTPEELVARSKVSVCTEATSAGSDWCPCACCRSMPTSSECVCCHTSELTLLGSLIERRCIITEDRRMQTVMLNVGPAAFAQKSYVNADVA